MGTQNENFRLNWNDFESNLSSAFQELRNDEDFFDVTLATDEDQVGAHRVVLSACSPHLKEMLRRHAKLSGNRTNQLIYLRGVRHSDLLAVLEFMYCGSVNVSQDQLNSFLAVAEDLKVKGLTHAAGKDSPDTPSTKNGTGVGKRSRLPTSAPSSAKKFRPEEQMKQEADDVELAGGEEGIEDYGEYDADTSGAVGFDEAGPSDPDAAKDIDVLIGMGLEEAFGDAVESKVIPVPSGGFECTLCGTVLIYKESMLRHVREKHVEANYVFTCPVCPKISNTKSGLRIHLSRYHQLKITQFQAEKYMMPKSQVKKRKVGKKKEVSPDGHQREQHSAESGDEKKNRLKEAEDVSF